MANLPSCKFKPETGGKEALPAPAFKELAKSIFCQFPSHAFVLGFTYFNIGVQRGIGSDPGPTHPDFHSEGGRGRGQKVNFWTRGR